MRERRGAGQRAFTVGADVSGDRSAGPEVARMVNHALLKNDPYSKPIARSLASNEAFYITGSSYTSTPAFPPPERDAARLAAAMEALMRRHGGSLCATPERWRRSIPAQH